MRAITLMKGYVVVGIITDLLKRTPVYVVDHSEKIQEQLYQPFAYGDVLLRVVDRDINVSILHIWPMENTVVLGMMDRRLPYCQEAIHAIRTHGYRAVVRNVGGLAVVADEGILNLSFIIPKRQDVISIQDGYELMTAFIQNVFKNHTEKIEHYEIVHSYCPGDYDLSINGKKFAGIAQRRFKDGIAISIYLSVCGDQQKRGELIKEFYETGLQNEETAVTFPEIKPEVMANISDLVGQSLTVKDVQCMIVNTLKEQGVQLETFEMTQSIKDEYQQFYDKMIDRNRKI